MTAVFSYEISAPNSVFLLWYFQYFHRYKTSRKTGKKSFPQKIKFFFIKINYSVIPASTLISSINSGTSSVRIKPTNFPYFVIVISVSHSVRLSISRTSFGITTCPLAPTVTDACIRTSRFNSFAFFELQNNIILILKSIISWNCMKSHTFVKYFLKKFLKNI